MTATKTQKTRLTARELAPFIGQRLDEATMLLSCYLEGRPLSPSDKGNLADLINELQAIRDGLK